jgi:DNA-binding transcriptional LysR family regulator
MELRHLRYFVAVVDAGGVSRAAERLHVSQPALSRQIGDLERHLGVRLFDRVGRRLVLTRDGSDLLGRSRRVLAEVDSVTARGQALGGGESGTLRVGATPHFIERVLPEVLRRYQKKWPAVEIQLVTDGGDGLIKRVRAGDIHIAVSVALRQLDGLGTRPLYPLRLLAVMPRTHRLAHRRHLEAQDLIGERMLLLTHEFRMRALLDEACQAARVQLSVFLESPSLQAIVALAAAGTGVGIVPSIVRLPRSRVRAIGMVHDGKPLGLWGGVVWDQRRYLPRCAERFIDELARFMKGSYPGHKLRAAQELPPPR